MHAQKFKPEDEIMRPITAPGVIILTPWHRKPPQTLFDFVPDLRSIWRADLADIAAMHTRQWEIDKDESGNILTASVGGSVIGITGWYRMSTSEAGLRWHGVIPDERKNGYSRQMIDLVCQAMPRKIRYVYEVTRSEQSRDSFCRCGFEVMTDPEIIRRTVEDAEYDIRTGGWVLRKSL
jgi:hypothetical protein